MSTLSMHPRPVTPAPPSAEARLNAIRHAEALVARYEQELLATPADTELHLARRAIRRHLIADWRNRITVMTSATRVDRSAA